MTRRCSGAKDAVCSKCQGVKQYSKAKERVGNDELIKHKGVWVCGCCLNDEFDPLALEDFMFRSREDDLESIGSLQGLREGAEKFMRKNQMRKRNGFGVYVIN